MNYSGVSRHRSITEMVSIIFFFFAAEAIIAVHSQISIKIDLADLFSQRRATTELFDGTRAHNTLLINDTSLTQSNGFSQHMNALKYRN